MRKLSLLLSAIALMATGSKAQTVATFDTLTLPGSDTFYLNYTHSGTDVGFNDGLAHFQCVYDTSFGGMWSTGFAYSNKHDTITSGFMNSYSAKTGSGYGGTGKYCAVWCTDPTTYQHKIMLKLTGAAVGAPVSGFYVTNGTYAYNSMRSGDSYAKKFGDTAHTGVTTGQGTAPDWFKLQVKGYLGGSLKPDSVDFYLADFRPAGTANDSIIKGWHWVNLKPLGNVDSLTFSLSSSDNGSFGMNTPAYFCIDNFTTNEAYLNVKDAAASVARIYPNPANDVLNIDITDEAITGATITDVKGAIVIFVPATTQHVEINTAGLAAGVYFINLSGAHGTAVAKFVRE